MLVLTSPPGPLSSWERGGQQTGMISKNAVLGLRVHRGGQRAGEGKTFGGSGMLFLTLYVLDQPV